MRLPGPALAILSCLVLAGCVGAAETGPPVTGEAEPGPLRFAPGDDAQAPPWVAGFELADQATRFSVHLQGVPGARVQVESLVLLQNDGLVTREAILQSASYPSPLVVEANLVFHNGAGEASCVLDLKAGEPGCRTLLAPGEILRGAWILRLAEGATADDLPPRSVALSTVG